MTVQITLTSHARLPKEARFLVAARVVDRLGGFTLTFLPLLLVGSFGASMRTAGLVGAAFGLATIPSRLLGGRLTDQLGRRRTIVLGLAGCAAAQLTIAAAPGLPVAAGAAVALGLCFEIYEPPSQALLADVTTPDQRVAAYSALGAAIATAGVVAGLLAAVLSDVGLRWLFVADAVSCLACAALVRAFLPAGPSRQPVHGRGRSPWRDSRVRAMLGAGTAFATVYMTMIVGLPLALHGDGIAGGWAGVLIAVSAATVILGRRMRLSRHRDPFGRMRTGYALLAFGLLLGVIVAALPPHGPAYLVPVVVWSLGDAILLGEPLAIVATLAPCEARGRYLAAYGLSWGVATTLAAPIAALLLAPAGPIGLWLACSVAALGLAVTQSRLRTQVTSA